MGTEVGELVAMSFSLVGARLDVALTMVGADVLATDSSIPFVGASVERSESIVGPTVGVVVSASSRRLVGVCVINEALGFEVGSVDPDVGDSVVFDAITSASCNNRTRYGLNSLGSGPPTIIATSYNILASYIFDATGPWTKSCCSSFVANKSRVPPSLLFISESGLILGFVKF